MFSWACCPFALEMHSVHQPRTHLSALGSRRSHGHLALPLSPQADLSSLPEIEKALAVFCMATYGEGDPTDNAQDFYDWLQETDVDLSGVKYAVSHPGGHVRPPEARVLEDTSSSHLDRLSPGLAGSS